MITDLPQWGLTEKEGVLLAGEDSFSLLTPTNDNKVLLVEYRKGNWPSYFVGIKEWDNEDIMKYIKKFCGGYTVVTNRAFDLALKENDYVGEKK